MRPFLTFSISLIIAANLHTAIAQSSATPAATPVTLRSLLLSELHSTHDNAEIKADEIESKKAEVKIKK